MPERSAEILLWLVPLAPLVAAVLIALVGKPLLRGASHWPCCLGFAISCAASWALFAAVVPSGFGDGGSKPALAAGYTFLDVGGIDVSIALRADAMAALMLVMITSVSTLVAVFASGYMRGDAGYARFFAVVSLFVFSMCMLVLAGNFVQLFVFWEGVGLCSYLLIGYWFRKPEAAAAATKAFIVNRVGDFFLLVGLFLISTTFGSLAFDDVLFDSARIASVAAENPTAITMICACLLLGAMGKSAQFPLHVWLPDAMEGPTPVSALIHAATMVTAGVYLVARSTPLFVHAPEVQLVVAGVGAVTALLAALIALTQNDLKRVLAYSTVSQLGYMFMALGAGAAGNDLAVAGATAAIFHLVTHGCFKALLFLSAGSVMHSMGDVIDMRRFGGLRSVLPVTHLAFLAGALALAGAPLMAGFWSKDEVLATLSRASAHAEHGAFFRGVFWVAVVTAFLTAFYTFRAYFLTFWGEVRLPTEAGDHPHDAPPSMAWPLRVLAVSAVVVGAIGAINHSFARYMERTPGIESLAASSHAEGHGAEHGFNLGLMAGSSVVAIAGIGMAYLLCGGAPSTGQSGVPGVAVLRALSENRFYCDELYELAVVRPLRWLAAASSLFDRYVVDRLASAIGSTPRVLGELPRVFHHGEASGYALLMWGGVLLYVLVTWRSLQ
ncbi:MAG: NADH-quinone oxidoreductase subunit L [Lacipirellulaceae bacterium]